MTTTTQTPVLTEAVVSLHGLQFNSKKFTGHDFTRWGVFTPHPSDDSEIALRKVADEADAAITRKGYVRTGGWVYQRCSGNHSTLTATVTVRPEGGQIVPGSIEWHDQFPGFWAATEAVEAWLAAHPGQFYNPSTIARRAKVDSTLVYTVLRYLDEHSFIAADGNGCWRKYAAKTR